MKKIIKPVNMIDILRVHEYSYVQKLEKITKFLQERDSETLEKGPNTFHLDSDTYMNQHTLNAASIAAGGAI